MIKPWRSVRSQIDYSNRIFSIRANTTVSPRTGAEHDFYVIDSSDWVNIIPFTDDQQVVMVKQYRHGSKGVTLEIPGGMLDPGDSPEKAARRELLEETGYEAEEWSRVGVVSPNPAIFNNRCHTFVARNLRKVDGPNPDQTEDIEVVLTPISDIPQLIRMGTIDHALVIAAFYFIGNGS